MKIKCHDNEPRYLDLLIEWHVRKAEGTIGSGHRHCSYCGSIHPEDLLTILKDGAGLEGADWKYGWPHKFYIEGVKNPMVGQIVVIGSGSGPDGKGGTFHKDILGSAPSTVMVKWYNVHLLDIVGTPLFNELVLVIKEKTGIQFIVTEQGLLYSVGGK